MEVFDLSKELLIVTGKGGVGKSALSAVIGRQLAARGRRVLLLEVDRRENLHPLLGVPPSDGEVISVPVEEGALYLVNLKPMRVADWVVRKKVKIGPLVNRVLDSNVYQRFVEGAPGLTQLAILGYALRVVQGAMDGVPPVDTVVLDAPATGHGVYLLDAPKLVAEALGEGPFAELAGEVATFAGSPGRCGVVIVTLAEEMPVQEALELRERLQERLGREPDLLVVNGVYPAVGPEEAELGEDSVLSLWQRRRRVNEEEIARLDEHWQGLRVELPLLPAESAEVLVRNLGERFDETVEEAP